MLAILAAALLAAAPQYDTIYTADGGRLVGTVIEEGPQGIAVQLPDGSTRRLATNEVSRIEYADGSVSTPSRPAPPPRPPTYRPPPTYAPPPYVPPPPSYAPPAYAPAPPHARRGQPPITPLYGAFGIGGAFLSGDAESGIPADNLFGSQLDLWMEGGLRLNPYLALGLYVDVGLGEPASQVRAECNALGADCTATTWRAGLLLRHTFAPRAYSTPWIATGFGYESGSVNLDYHDYYYGDHSGAELFSYSGWEGRLMTGIDLRSSPVFGVGLYGGIAFGRYTQYEDALGRVDISGERFHTTIQGGVRFTLFP